MQLVIKLLLTYVNNNAQDSTAGEVRGAYHHQAVMQNVIVNKNRMSVGLTIPVTGLCR
jgi:hypothetical protein